MREYEGHMRTVTLANHLTALTIGSARLLDKLEGDNPELEAQFQALLTEVNGLRTTNPEFNERLDSLNQRVVRLQVEINKATQVMETRRQNLTDFTILVLGEQISGSYGHARMNDIVQAFSDSLKPSDTEGHFDFDLIMSDTAENSAHIHEASAHLSQLFGRWTATNPEILKVKRSKVQKPWEKITLKSARTEINNYLKNPDRPEDAVEIRDWAPSRNLRRLGKGQVLRVLNRVKNDLGQYDPSQQIGEVVGEIDFLLTICSSDMKAPFGLITRYGESKETGRSRLERVFRKFLWIQKHGTKK